MNVSGAGTDTSACLGARWKARCILLRRCDTSHGRGACAAVPDAHTYLTTNHTFPRTQTLACAQLDGNFTQYHFDYWKTRKFWTQALPGGVLDFANQTRLCQD